MEINFIMGYLNLKAGREQEAIRNLEHAFELQKKVISSKDPSIAENQECDLFINWLTNNLTSSENYDIRVATPVVYRKFDQYLMTMRRQLNHD